MKITKDKFDCKVVTETYPKIVREFLDIKKFGDIIEVPVRQQGMTSSGLHLECHNNVFKLMHTYGGSEVIGYAVHEFKELEGYVCFNPHSNWLTPENKLIDVTQKEEKVIHFLPIANIDMSYQVELYSCAISYLPNTDCLCVSVEQDPPKIKNKHVPVYTDYFVTEDFSLGNYKRITRCKPEVHTKGGFEKPSSATNRSWKDIWQTEIDKGYRYPMSYDDYELLENPYGDISI